MESTNIRLFKRLILTTILFFAFFIVFANFVSAFTIIAVTPSYINRTIPTIMNFTINNTDNVNITQIIFTLPMEGRFYLGNGTNADNTIFTNYTQGPFITLTWINITPAGFISINGTRSFWFNTTLMNLGNIFFTNITLQANHILGQSTSNSYNYNIYFGFSAYVKNETGGNENNVNISIYSVVEGGNGPPTETLQSNVLSDVNGAFSFASINGSFSAYKLKMFRYGPDTNCVFANATCNATKTGTSLPPFPAMMYYPTTADMPAFEFMRPPSFNGTTFYLNPATTLRLYANNLSNAQRFGYEVIDQVVGFPIESSVMSSVLTKDIVVPLGRNYTVMFARFPGFGASGFPFYPLCDGNFMNDTACPSPPISNSTLGTLAAGQILIVNQSMNIGKYRLTGCINTGGINNSRINITSINLKMMPWAGFIPPMRADMGDINITTDINYTGSAGCNTSTNLAFYNISVMGATSGINYFLEIYAKNATNEAGNPSNANNLAVFQNITITGNTNYNLTLYKLAGRYYASGTSVNTSQIKINILNSTGGALTNNMNANVKVKFGSATGVGTINYIIESMTNGAFYMPILDNSALAKLMVFANDAPPKEVTINLSASEQNITLVSMTDGSGVGMKRINETGGMQMINSSELDVSKPMTLRFLRNTGDWGSSCNIFNPDSSCILTSMDAKRFNPLTAMIAGKVNMEMKMTATNVTLTFVNFDMFIAKQPPMDSVINDQASGGGSTTNQMWQFGSFAPANSYEYVIITMPYNDVAIDDSASMTLSAPNFYDENWNVVWNSSRGDTSANLSDDFIDYNNSVSGLYRNYTLSGGQICSKTDSSLSAVPCFVNTTSNMIYMRIPHFSGVGPSIGGTAPVTVAAVATPAVTSSGGVVGATVVSVSNTWSTMNAEQEYKYVVGKSDLVIDSVLVTPSETLSSVKLVVRQLIEKPVSILKEPVGSLFKYAEIVKENILNNQILNAKIMFSVDKSWVDAKGAKENIVMLRYNNNLWEKLTTNFVGVVGNKYQYEAVTSGFSYFAITYQTPVQQTTQKTSEVTKTSAGSETPVVDVTQPENLLEQKQATKTNWLPIVIVLVSVLVVGLVVYFVYRKTQTKNLGAYRYKPARK